MSIEAYIEIKIISKAKFKLSICIKKEVKVT
jgi:hypothetical protein